MSRSRIIAGKAVIIVEVLDNVQKSIRGIQSNLNKLSNTVGNVGEQAFRTGFFGSILSGAGINQFYKFEDSLLYLQIKLGIFGKATGKNKEIMQEMEKTIRHLGRTTSFTSTQIAEGAATLAQGGFSYQEVTDSLQALLDLSRASRTEITSTAEALVRALRAFNLPTTMAGEIASQFVRATRSGTLELEDLTTALRYSQGTAASLSQSLPTMLALFAEMSNKGMAGSIAGTSMNTAMSQIVKKMEDIQAIFPDFQPLYGPNGFDFPRTLQYLIMFTKNMDQLQRKVLFQDIFNLRGERAATAAFDIESVIALQNEIASANTEARKAAETMDQGLGGAARIAVSAIQELALTIDQAAAEPMKNFLKAIQEIANSMSAFFKERPGLSTLVLFSPGILVAAGAGMLFLAKGLRIVAAALGGLRGLMRSVAIPMAEGMLPLISGAASIGGKAGASARGAGSLANKLFSTRISLGGKSTKVLSQSYVEARKGQILYTQRMTKANAIGAAAEARAAKSLEKSKDIIRQVSVARARNNELLALNTKRIKEAVRAEQLRVAKGRAAATRASLSNQISSLVQDRKSIRASMAGSVPSRYAMEALKFREEGLTREITLLRKRAAAVKVEMRAAPLSQKATELLKQRAVLLGKQNRLETVGAALSRSRASIDARRIRQLVPAQDLLASAVSGRAKTASPGTITKMLSGTGMARGLTTAGAAATRAGGAFVGFFKVLWTARKFIPSWWTIIDILILFGDKIPVVSTVLGKFGAAFSGAFKEIGKIGTYFKGPLEIFRASMEAFSAGDTASGIKALKMAFQGLVGIIKNQLVAAWSVFKGQLDNVWQIIRGIGTSLWEIFNSLITSVSSTLDSVLGSIANVADMIMPGSTGDFGNTFLNGVNTAAEVVAKLLNSLPYIFAIFVETLSSTFDQIINKMEGALYSALSAAGLVDDTRIQQAISGKNFVREKTATAKISKLMGEWEASSKRITEAFKNTSKENLKDAELRNKDSRMIANYSLQQANFLRQNLAEQARADAIRRQREAAEEARKKAELQLQSGAFGPKTNSSIVAVTNAIATALVGSAQEIQRNIIQYGKPIEEKQLDVLEDIRDDQRRGLRQGGTLLPIAP